MAVLLALRQHAWLEREGPDQKTSPLNGVSLSGADVFYLAERAVVGPDGNPETAGALLRDSSLNLSGLHLEGASLQRAYLQGACLNGVHLEGAQLYGAHLEGSALREAHLEGASLVSAHLESADLRAVYFDEHTRLAEAVLGPSPLNDWWDHLRLRNRNVALGDIKWRGIDLTAVPWHTLQRLGDERNADWLSATRRRRAIVRAYRQVAAQLRAQGMSEEADRFSYRAQVRQRGVLLRTWRLPQYVFSWLLAILAGYGYRPGRTLFWYLLVVLGYTFAYLHVGPLVGVPLSPLGALVFSVTSFHGRGFFPGGSPGHSITLDDPLTVLAASEAVIGLFIEISFIATFTQRYFGAK